MALPSGAIAQNTFPDATRRRPASVGPFVKARWLLLLGAIVMVGLGLRLVTLEHPSLNWGQGLPWLHPPLLTLYFPDSQGRFLVPVSRRVPRGEASPQGAIQHLLRGPKDRPNLGAVFSAGARLLRFDLQHRTAIVETTRASSPLEREAVYRTLQNFPEVKEVHFVVDGEMDQVPSPLLHPIYYSYDSYLVPQGGATSPLEAVRQYLAGPVTGSGLQGLPSDANLIEFRLDARRGLAYVNFTYTDSVRQLALAQPEQMRRILLGIIATLTDFPEVKAVKLDFQGHDRLGLGQCSDLLRAPQLKPPILNDEGLLGRR